MMNETVALVGLAVVLAKTLEKLVDFVTSKLKSKDEDKTKDGPDLEKALKEIRAELIALNSVTTELLKLINLKDMNGTPMIYFPRNIEARQLESVNMLSDQAHSQENNIKILDKIADKMIDVSIKTDQILHEVRK